MSFPDLAREVAFTDEPKSGLSEGDVVAFTVPDDGRPYAAFREDDPEGRVDGVYLFRAHDALSPSDATVRALQHDHPETHLEVQRHDEFWGFRSVYAQGRLLQATRKGACRLRFHGENFGTWEEWTLDARSEPLRTPWTRRHVILRHRRLDKLELRVVLVRVGVARHVAALPSPATVCGVDDAGERDASSIRDVDPRSRGDPLALPGSDDDGIDERPTPRGAMFRHTGDGLFHPSSVSASASASAMSASAISASSRRGLGGPPPSARSPPPGARSRARFGAASRVGQTDAAREHTSVLHSMSGVVAKEFVVALQREVSARASVEREVLELHAASEDLRAWTLQELERLRGYARTQVDELTQELVHNRTKVTMAELLLEDANVSKEQAAALARRAHRDAEHRAKVAARIMLRSAFATTRRWAFAEWCAHVQQSRHARVSDERRANLLKRALARARGNLAARALDAWRSWVDECAATKRLAHARAARWRRMRRRAGFVAWRDYAVERFYGGPGPGPGPGPAARLAGSSRRLGWRRRLLGEGDDTR